MLMVKVAAAMAWLWLLMVPSAAQPAADEPPPYDARATQAVLRPDEIVVRFILAEPNSFRWVMSHEHVVFDRIAGRAVIEAAAARVREAFVTAAPRGEVTDAGSRLGAMLFDGLTTADDRPMVIIPDGALRDLPFEMLMLQGRALSERHAVTYARSDAALIAQRANRVEHPAVVSRTHLVLAWGFSLAGAIIAVRQLVRS